MILQPDELRHNNPNYATIDANSLRRIHVSASILERDVIPKDKRGAGPRGSVVFINGIIYQYTHVSIADVNWTNTENWVVGILGDGPSWSISEVSANTSAEAFIYYLIDATSAPIVMTIPEWSTSNTDEYYFKLNFNTHKVTITDEITSWIIPTCGGSLHIKGGADGWKTLTDNSGFSCYSIVTEDRDFSDGDGFENNVTYACSPSTPGEGRVFILPAPKTYSADRAIRATFTLVTEGTLTVVREDGGYIAGETQQVISRLNSSFTLLEANGEYYKVQDSRQTIDTNVTQPLYRLDDNSDVVGFKALASSKEDVRYGVETTLVSPIIDGLTFVSHVAYITDVGTDYGLIPDSQIRALVSIRLTNAPSTSFSGIKSYYEYAYCDPDGTNEVHIINSSQFNITSNSFAQFPIDTDFPETDLTGKRLIVRAWLAEISTDGTANSVTVKIEGNEGAKFLRVVPAVALSHNDFEGRGSLSCHTLGAITGLVDALAAKAVLKVTPTAIQQLELQKINSSGQYVGSNVFIAKTESELRTLLASTTPINIKLLEDITLTSALYNIYASNIIVEGPGALIINSASIGFYSYAVSDATIDINTKMLLSNDVELNYQNPVDNDIALNINFIDAMDASEYTLSTSVSILGKIYLSTINHSDLINLESLSGSLSPIEDKGSIVTGAASNNLIISKGASAPPYTENKGILNINIPDTFYPIEWFSPLAYHTAGTPDVETWTPSVEIGGSIDYAIMPKLCQNIKTSTIYQYWSVCSGHTSFTDRDPIFRKSTDGGETWTGMDGTGTWTKMDFFNDSNVTKIDVSGCGTTPTGRFIVFFRAFNSGGSLIGYHYCHSDNDGVSFSTPVNRGDLGMYVFDTKFCFGEKGELIMNQAQGQQSLGERKIVVYHSFDDGETWELRSTVFDPQIVGFTHGEPVMRDFGNGMFVLINRSANHTVSSGTFIGMDLPMLFASYDYGKTWANGTETVTEAQLDAGQVNSGWLPLEGLTESLGDGLYQNALPWIERVDYNGHKYCLIVYFCRSSISAESRDEVLRMTAFKLDEWLARGYKAIKSGVPVTVHLADNTLSYGQTDGNGSVLLTGNRPEFLWTLCDNIGSSSTSPEVISTSREMRTVVETMLDSIETATSI